MEDSLREAAQKCSAIKRGEREIKEQEESLKSD